MTVLAISGGVGGAKLAEGLYRVLAPEALTVVANTGDDFEHLGLHIAPDLDTLTYTLAGLANPETGWGRAGETWTFMGALEALGGETWFRLGDGDLATHVERTRRLRAGETLSAIAADFARRLGVRARLVPMSDQPVRTVVDTELGAMPFQRYFVEHACTPRVRRFGFEGAAIASPAPALGEALADPRLEAIVVCPSNPFVSVDPVLSVAGLREAIAAAPAPVVAVSPLVGGRALKGPTAKMMRELGLPVDAAAVAAHYGDVLDGFVLDRADEPQGERVAAPVAVTDTVMRDAAARERLARAVLGFAATLRRAPGGGR